MFDKIPAGSVHVKNIPLVPLSQLWTPSTKKRLDGSPQLDMLSPQAEDNIAVVALLRNRYGSGTVFFGDAYYDEHVGEAAQRPDGVEVGIYVTREAFEAAERASETQH
jgi:hypothetical protein